MSLDKNLTNRIFRIAIQAESAVIILINQQASAFGTDISGQFFVSPPKRFTGPIEAMRHPHFHDRANQEAAWQAVVNGRFNWPRTHRLLQRRWRDLGCLTEPVAPGRGRHADFYWRYVWWLDLCRRSFAQTAPGTPRISGLRRAWVFRPRRTGQPLATNAAAVLPSSYTPCSRHPQIKQGRGQARRLAQSSTCSWANLGPSCYLFARLGTHRLIKD